MKCVNWVSHFQYFRLNICLCYFSLSVKKKTSPQKGLFSLPRLKAGKHIVIGLEHPGI
jgi:hypothetical protein